MSLAAKTCVMFCNNMLQKEQESDVSLFITHVQAFVAIIRLLEIAWILTSDCITLRGNQTISGSYVTRCKRSSSWVGKTRNTYRLYCKKELLNTHYSLLSRYKAQHRHCTRFAVFNVEKQAARFTVPYLCRSDKDESPWFFWLMSLIKPIFIFNSVENKGEMTFKSHGIKPGLPFTVKYK